jgi:hypothetical protein
MLPDDPQDLGASADADQALVASDQAASRLAPSGFDPSREERWAAFDAHYDKWQRRVMAPAFIQGVSEHSWCVQTLVEPEPPRRGWLYRLFNDPPALTLAEPYYNGWPGDHRGWMRFPTKEAARDFYQLANGFISFDEYRSRPRERLTMEHFDLDERGDFAIAAGARSDETPTAAQSEGR